MDYYEKYIKYKNKYLSLKNQSGGGKTHKFTVDNNKYNCRDDQIRNTDNYNYYNIPVNKRRFTKDELEDHKSEVVIEKALKCYNDDDDIIDFFIKKTLKKQKYFIKKFINDKVKLYGNNTKNNFQQLTEQDDFVGRKMSEHTVVCRPGSSLKEGIPCYNMWSTSGEGFIKANDTLSNVLRKDNLYLLKRGYNHLIIGIALCVVAFLYKVSDAIPKKHFHKSTFKYKNHNFIIKSYYFHPLDSQRNPLEDCISIDEYEKWKQENQFYNTDKLKKNYNILYANRKYYSETLTGEEGPNDGGIHSINWHKHPNKEMNRKIYPEWIDTTNINEIIDIYKGYYDYEKDKEKNTNDRLMYSYRLLTDRSIDRITNNTIMINDLQVHPLTAQLILQIGLFQNTTYRIDPEKLISALGTELLDDIKVRLEQALKRKNE